MSLFNRDADISFSDILIRPQFSDISSRSHVSLQSNMGNFNLCSLPVFSANMPQITGWKMALEMFKNGGMGILHRFCSVEEAVEEYNKTCDHIKTLIDRENTLISLKALTNTQRDNIRGYCVGVSTGVKNEDKERVKALYDAGARIFVIDIAHGHCSQMRKTIEWMRSYKPDITVIAGNIATFEGCRDLYLWGAQVIKIGIGSGKVCRTRSNAGVGVAQFSALLEIKEGIQKHLSNEPIRIIADGGVRTAGDVAKSLICAHAVMVGAILSGTSETPGDAFPEPGTDLVNRTYYKIYGGSASLENKVANGQESRFIEGETIKVPFKGHAKYLLREIADGIRSACSYSGATNLEEFRDKVRWNVISEGGRIESKL